MDYKNISIKMMPSNRKDKLYNMVFSFDSIVILSIHFGRKGFKYNAKIGKMYLKRYEKRKRYFYTEVGLSYWILYKSDNIENNLRGYSNEFNLILLQ